MHSLRRAASHTAVILCDTLHLTFPVLADGQILHIRALGLASIANDVTPELARGTIGSIAVLEALHASSAVKAVLADRIR